MRSSTSIKHLVVLISTLLLSVSLAQSIDRFVFLQNTEAGSMSPVRDFSVAGLGIHAHLYDTLVDFEGPNLEVTPKLAVSWATIDEVTWEFKLREGVRFHDGSAFTAADVEFSLDLYAQDGSTRLGYVANIADVVVVDDLTLRIVTTVADAGLLSRLAYLYILPKSAFEARGTEEFGVNPVGTGAYAFVSWERDVELVLEAYGDYWGKPATVRQLVVRPVREASARVAELRTGRADVISLVPVEMAGELASDPALRLVAATGVRQVYFPLNTLRPPFDDVRVRQAINYGVDRDAIVEYILEGFGEVRGGPFAERQWGADPEAERYTYDPDRARELLAEAGYPNGVSVTWHMTPGAVVKGTEIAEAVANMLGQVGFDIRIELMENAERLDRFYSGDFDITLTTWSLQSDPDSVVSGLRVESTASSYFADDEVDRLMRLGRSTVDLEARRLIYNQLEELLIWHAPWLLVHAQDQLYGLKADSSWEPYSFAGNAGMTYLVPMSAE